MAFFDSFTDSIKQKWLQFFQANREWIVLQRVEASIPVLGLQGRVIVIDNSNERQLSREEIGANVFDGGGHKSGDCDGSHEHHHDKSWC